MEMARRYGLNLDAQLMVRPLMKDKPRKVTSVEAGDRTQITLTCSKPAQPKNRR